MPQASRQCRDLLQSAREATAHYRDRNVAIAAGYRRVGRDFPSMGEHWLNRKLIVEGKLDVTPAADTHLVKVAGRPVLTGVVYAIPLEQGESKIKSSPRQPSKHQREHPNHHLPPQTPARAHTHIRPRAAERPANSQPITPRSNPVRPRRNFFFFFFFFLLLSRRICSKHHLHHVGPFLGIPQPTK